jgi:hypothetical protein
MNDLIDRLRVSAEPVGKLLLEAADALQNAQMRIAELTETLRAVVEIGNSQRSREFADVKKTLAKARVGGLRGAARARRGSSSARGGGIKAGRDRARCPTGGGKTPGRGDRQRDVQGNPELAPLLGVSGTARGERSRS